MLMSALSVFVAASVATSVAAQRQDPAFVAGVLAQIDVHQKRGYKVC